MSLLYNIHIIFVKISSSRPTPRFKHNPPHVVSGWVSAAWVHSLAAKVWPSHVGFLHVWCPRWNQKSNNSPNNETWQLSIFRSKNPCNKVHYIYKELSQKLVFSRLLVFWVWGHLQIILSTIKSLPCSHVFWGVRSQPFLPASILAIRDPSLFKRKEVPWKDLPRKDLHVQSALQRGATRGMKGVWTGVSQSEELWSFCNSANSGSKRMMTQFSWWYNLIQFVSEKGFFRIRSSFTWIE